MKPFRFATGLIVVVGAIVAAANLAIAAERKPPVSYFLEKASAAADEPINLPAGATDVVVAKVRFERATSLAGRHGEAITNDILFTNVKIIEVTRGHAEIGQVFGVRMGFRNDHRDFAYPHTPDQLGRNYTAVICSSGDGLHRLASFPISLSQYAEWDAEKWAYEQQRGLAGYRD